jgi:hypothetical protein
MSISNYSSWMNKRRRWQPAPNARAACWPQRSSRSPQCCGAASRSPADLSRTEPFAPARRRPTCAFMPCRRSWQLLAYDPIVVGGWLWNAAFAGEWRGAGTGGPSSYAPEQVTEILAIVPWALSNREDGDDLPLLINHIQHAPAIDTKTVCLQACDVHVCGDLECVTIRRTRRLGEVAHGAADARLDMTRQRHDLVKRGWRNPQAHHSPARASSACSACSQEISPISSGERAVRRRAR